MKKELVIAAFLAFALSSCAAEQPAPPERLPEAFTVNAEIHDGELNAAAELKRAPEGWEVTMTAPETVEGMRFELTDIECAAGIYELNYSFAAETLPCGSPLMLMVRALDGCVRGEDEGTVAGQSYLLSYKDGAPDTLTVGSVNVSLGEIQLTNIKDEIQS